MCMVSSVYKFDAKMRIGPVGVDQRIGDDGTERCPPLEGLEGVPRGPGE